MKTMRDELNEPEFVGGYAGELILVEPDDPILDAIVIGCEECGGSGHFGYEPEDTEHMDLVDCPSCHGKSFVVDAETVEACAKAAQTEVVRKLMGVTDSSENYCARLALAVLEAVHIAAADEVVEVDADVSREVRHVMQLAPGDTLYIVRAVTADCHSKEE